MKYKYEQEPVKEILLSDLENQRRQLVELYIGAASAEYKKALNDALISVLKQIQDKVTQQIEQLIIFGSL